MKSRQPSEEPPNQTLPVGSSLVSLEHGDVVLQLGLAGCIETTARQVRQKLLGLYLQDLAVGFRIEEALDLLTTFLSQQDFQELRKSAPHLDGQQFQKVRLYRKPNGQVGWQLL